MTIPELSSMTASGLLATVVDSGMFRNERECVTDLVPNSNRREGRYDCWEYRNRATGICTAC